MTSIFSELLTERGLITQADVAHAEQVCGQAGARLPATLVRLGMVEEGALAEVLGTMAGAELLPRDRFPEEFPRLEGLNPAFLRKRAVVPLGVDEQGRLRIAMADPTDSDAAAALAFAAGAPIGTAAVATFSDIGDFLAGAGLEEKDGEEALGGGDWAEDMNRVLESESEAPVIRLVQRLLAGAVDRKASDVHIEPLARAVCVRYRIDGRLIEVDRLPDGLAPAIASRIKVMAGLDIAETRLPQDGRLRVNVRGREIDVRVATSPTTHGESVVLRLLGRGNVELDLRVLGIPAAALARLERALDRPHGIILVTGPTGSGKTTTLYAALQRLLRPEVKILTVEDPVEVFIDGINQVQVRPEIELTYAKALRAFLRQDPDILMIGEIRDRDTAEIALRAALTGHLVLSTLHTNSALGAFTRLNDIGIEPYLAASSVIAAVAQRLIRAVCPECASDRAIHPDEVDLFARAGVAAPASVREAQGCRRCGGSGFSGRLMLIEVVDVDDDLRAAVRAGTVEELRREVAPEETLFGHGLALVAAGLTTLGEVRRAVN